MQSKRPVYVAGLDRGVRPIGDWSTWMILSSCSRPWTFLCAPGRCRARCRRLATAFDSTSLTSVDFAEPHKPVKHVSVPSRVFTSTFFGVFVLGAGMSRLVKRVVGEE